MAAFEIVEREILARIDAFQGPQASRALAALAAEKRDEVIAADAPGRPEVTTYVDGREGAVLESVRPDGTIRFEFSRADAVARFIFQTLVMRSPYRPKRPGARPPTHYRDEHLIFIDGREVEKLPERIGSFAEIVFVNIQPYARKIESGPRSRFRARLTDRRPGQSWQAPNGVYEVTAALARRQFANIAGIGFEYRAVIGGVMIHPMSGASHARSGTAAAMHAKGQTDRQHRFKGGSLGGAGSFGGRAHNFAQNRYPAIVVTPP
ncbi:MAG: hypothetical protein FJX60_22425 [Alphaproteobacteria bacterium]|nr:hypothetical protein [Alphaproteobacteria bacterium]